MYDKCIFVKQIWLLNIYVYLLNICAKYMLNIHLLNMYKYLLNI